MTNESPGSRLFYSAATKLLHFSRKGNSRHKCCLVKTEKNKTTLLGFPNIARWFRSGAVERGSGSRVKKARIYVHLCICSCRATHLQDEFQDEESKKKNVHLDRLRGEFDDFPSLTDGPLVGKELLSKLLFLDRSLLCNHLGVRISSAPRLKIHMIIHTHSK